MNGTSAARFKDSLEDYIDSPFPNGESYVDVEKRIANFVDFLRKEYDGKHVAIVDIGAGRIAIASVAAYLRVHDVEQHAQFL